VGLGWLRDHDRVTEKVEIVEKIESVIESVTTIVVTD
jgi:hypothetical protein